MGLDLLACTVGGLGVLARLVQVVVRPPDLPAVDLVRLPRGRAYGDDRRPRFLGERRPLDARAGEDERAGGRVYLLAVELEPRATGLNEVELLLLVLVVRLVVFVDDPVAGLPARPGVDAERPDPEVMPDRAPGRAAVVDLVDLVEFRHCVIAHVPSFTR